MGAKQSKRSVDISGKESEGVGDVAAAGGPGKLEPLADADTLKPHLNGDAHIQTPEEVSEKEKQLENGASENEKDASTEKEEKAQGDAKEKEAVTNGETEPKVDENGESTPAATPEQDSGKKPKKEKVKKKWSLRSISFSRKDKPKQEKKQKEDEAKANGEPEKVPEEVTEQAAEVTEAKSEVEMSANKDEKTPQTPETEPLTNGSSAPETPKETSPIKEEAPVAVSEPIPEEPKLEVQPEQLPINGLSLEDKKDLPAEDKKVEIPESKAEEPTPAAETVPVPEIPDKSEVCVEKTPFIESNPPPLPANPPPSSVASFAATTMAPHLTENTLIDNTTNLEVSAPLTVPQESTDNNIDNAPVVEQDNQIVINTETNIESPPPAPKEDKVHEKEEAIELEGNLSETSDNAVESIADAPMETIKREPSPEVEEKQPIIEAEPPAIADEKPLIKENGKVEEAIVDNAIKTNGFGDCGLNKDFQGNECDKELTENENKGDVENITKKTKDLTLTNGNEMEYNGNMEATEMMSPDADESEHKMPISPDLSSCEVPPPDAPRDESLASESFPLPPSELCPSESDASAASPEPDDAALPAQEIIAIADKMDIVVPEVEIPSNDVITETSTEVAAN